MGELIDFLAGWLFPFWIPAAHAERCRTASANERRALELLTRGWSARHWTELSRRLSQQGGRRVDVTGVAGLLPHVMVPVTLGVRTVLVSSADGPASVRYTPAAGSLRLDGAGLRRMFTAVEADIAAAQLAAKAASFIQEEQERGHAAERAAKAGLGQQRARWDGHRRVMAEALQAGAEAQRALDRRKARLGARRQARREVEQKAGPILQELQARQERRRLAVEQALEPGSSPTPDDAKRIEQLDAACAEQLAALDQVEAALHAAEAAEASERQRITEARRSHEKALARLEQEKTAAATLAASLRAEIKSWRDGGDIAADAARVQRALAGLGDEGGALAAQLRAVAPWTLTPSSGHSAKRIHLRAVETLLGEMDAEIDRAKMPPLAG